MIVISIINMDNSNLQVSVETPDLLRNGKTALELATGALLPGSLHYGINSNNEKQVQGTIGFPGLPGLPGSPGRPAAPADPAGPAQAITASTNMDEIVKLNALL